MRDKGKVRGAGSYWEGKPGREICRVWSRKSMLSQGLGHELVLKPEDRM